MKVMQDDGSGAVERVKLVNERLRVRAVCVLSESSEKDIAL